jgi:hypothetical protein
MLAQTPCCSAPSSPASVRWLTSVALVIASYTKPLDWLGQLPARRCDLVVRPRASIRRARCRRVLHMCSPSEIRRAEPRLRRCTRSTARARPSSRSICRTRMTCATSSQVRRPHASPRRPRRQPSLAPRPVARSCLASRRLKLHTPRSRLHPSRPRVAGGWGRRSRLVPSHPSASAPHPAALRSPSALPPQPPSALAPQPPSALPPVQCATLASPAARARPSPTSSL